METIKVAEAQQDLGLLVQQVLIGAKPIIIEAQNNQQTVLLSLAQYRRLNASLKASNNHQPTEPVKRVLGLGMGDIWISDDFDEPLPEEFWFGETGEDL